MVSISDKGRDNSYLANCFRKLKRHTFTLGFAFNEEIVSDVSTTDRDIITDQDPYAVN
jgi:hypothetical protein